LTNPPPENTADNMQQELCSNTNSALRAPAPRAILIAVSHPKKIFDEIHYELVRCVAEGGMGIVYEARQHGVDQFSKSVAIKVIREEFSAIEEFRQNFVGEARLVSDLIHANIVQTYHLGATRGRYFMVMEFVNGINGEEFIERHTRTGRQIPVDLAAFIVSRICRGLAYAHQKTDRRGRNLGIVHRDVGPRNVLLSFEGDVKLTDFGIAKALDLMYNEEGEVIAGKDEYLSPEQARKEITDARADIFSLGIVLSELLLGTNIFIGPTDEQTRHNICEMPLPDFREQRPEISAPLAQILARSLERSRENRYASANEMLTALEVYLYSDGYGPTHEKFAGYLTELGHAQNRGSAPRWQSAPPR